MSITKTYGNFELIVCTEGHPNGITIRHIDNIESKGITFNHTEIRDLKHCIEIAERECINNLPDKYKNEV